MALPVFFEVIPAFAGMRTFFTVLFIVIIFSGMAVQACPFAPPSATAEEASKIMEQAVFIGKGQIIDISGNDFIFDVVQTYSGISEGQIKVYGLNDCGRIGISANAIYEEIIYKDDNGKYRYAPTNVFSLQEKTIKNIRNHAALSLKLNHIKKFCKNTKGIWVDHEEKYPVRSDCHYPVHDEGRKCKDSSECEGFCLPEKDSGGGKDGTAYGRCSEWKNLHDVSGVVQNGHVSRGFMRELRK